MVSHMHLVLGPFFAPWEGAARGLRVVHVREMLLNGVPSYGVHPFESSQAYFDRFACIM